ncbi:MAG: glycosyltransferase family 2 protein, partial [Gammaproteobacteria bacterium]|nr:glycosyltransferase family 2 protein [Gammaproteobacteria bacterium]
MKEVLISFIIPHKGRELFLQKTIESVIQQKIDTSLLEVIIVTQNNELTEKIKSYTNKISLNIYIRPETENISALRNFGVEKSTGKYLAFLDADVELSSNWT